MQRFLVLIVLLSFSLPVGLSIAGCGHNTNNYCLKNGHAYGPTTSQVAYITLQPETTGLSLSWGQTSSLNQPVAYNCLNTTETVASYTYATTNDTIADISPTGIVCAGTWNRYSEGIVAPYTVCTPPTGSSLGNCGTSTNPNAGTNAACGTAQVTATGASVTSNPVNVYIHPPVTSIAIGSSTGTNSSGGSSGSTAITQSQCYSQGTTVSEPGAPGTPETLLSETEVAGPDGTLIPMADMGTITYTASNPNVVTINNTINPTSTTAGASPNGTVTANQPGATVITASVAQASSAAGYFYTCPPKSINLAINGQTTATVEPASPPTVTATVTDTNGVTLTGTALTFSSTEPQNLAVSSAGLVTANYPSTAEIYALCQPSNCNPAPIEQIGYYGTGMPVVSNKVQVNSPGRVSDQIWMASTNSQFFSEVDLTTGTTGSPIRLPYVPNSMVADQSVASLYFGSYRELMIYTTASNSLSKEDTNVPGVVLAVSPDNTTIVICDQIRQVIYLYTVATGAYTSTTGQATHAQFSPDGTTVYITGPNGLYVHNTVTGWNTYTTTQATNPLSPEGTSCTPLLNNVSTDPYCGRDLALTVPQVGPYISGTATDAYSFCPNTTVNPPIYYPQADTVQQESDHLAATPNGTHIIGASATGDQLMDLWLYADSGLTTPGVPSGGCPQATPTTALGQTFYHYQVPPISLSGITPTEIDQVVSSPDSSIAFVTYQSATASGLLPSYVPSTTPNAAGTLNNIQLSGTAGAPIAGAFSPDASIFFVGTQGDGLVHMITNSTTTPGTWTDTGTINPALVNSSQQPTAPQFFAVKSRSNT